MLEVVAIAVAIILIVLVAVLLLAARRPDSFHLARSTRISAPAERIYPLISNLRQMNRWNPFLQSDPQMKIVYSGPESGRGAAHDWAGSKKAGAGRIEIRDARLPSYVAMSLDIVRPFACHNLVEFTLKPQQDATEVTWAMSGRMAFINKLCGLFMDMDKMIGSQFDRGLADLKALAEA
jgi:hypothetical protein